MKVTLGNMSNEPAWAEPIPEENYVRETMHSFQWYNNRVPSLKTRRPWFDVWAEKAGRLEETAEIPTEYLGTVCVMARMMARGFVFNETNINWMNNKVDELVEQFPPKKRAKGKKVDVSLIRANRKMESEAATGAYMEKIDAIVDRCINTGKIQSLESLEVANLPQSEIQYMVDYYSLALAEYREVYESEDGMDLFEAYEGWTYPFTKKMIKLHEDIIRFLGNMDKAKKNRRGRPRKIKTMADEVSAFQYMKADKETGVRSINSQKVIGANVLYAFDTKKRVLIKYVSDSVGFGVKGTTLQNVLLDKSSQKTIRKPKEFLAGFMKEKTANGLASVFDGVRAKEKVPTPRTNGSVLLLKVT